MTTSPHSLRRTASAIAILCAMSSLTFLSGCVDPVPPPLLHRSDPNVPAESLPSDQFQEVAELLSRSEGRVGVAIINITPRVVFQHAGDERFELASVAKIYILVAYLDRLAQEGRGPGPEEYEAVRAMIEYSDNDSATSLFHAVGGADGINTFLAAHSLSLIEPALDGSWGSMRASPIQLGEFLVRLYFGEVLDVSQTSLSFALLGNVIEEQSWGVGAVGGASAVDEVYLKNGWLPGEEGWLVNSVGLLKSTNRTFVLVFMSDRQPDFDRAVQEIEAAVRLLRAPLFGPSPGPTSTPDLLLTPVPTPEPAPAAPHTPTVTPQPGPLREPTRSPVLHQPPPVRTGVR